jgi:hypothetical protein
LRLAVVSPFVDRRHGSERALAELLERLARDYHCAIHLYAERADDLPLAASKLPDSSESGSIVWHKVPSIRGPHLVKFVAWMFANGFLRWWHRVFRRLSFDLVLSPGINCLDADVIIVHALFRRLQELAHAKGSTETRRDSWSFFFSGSAGILAGSGLTKLEARSSRSGGSHLRSIHIKSQMREVALAEGHETRVEVAPHEQK